MMSDRRSGMRLMGDCVPVVLVEGAVEGDGRRGRGRATNEWERRLRGVSIEREAKWWVRRETERSQMNFFLENEQKACALKMGKDVLWKLAERQENRLLVLLISLRGRVINKY
jgi:hypothetical protein